MEQKLTQFVSNDLKFCTIYTPNPMSLFQPILTKVSADVTLSNIPLLNRAIRTRMSWLRK